MQAYIYIFFIQNVNFLNIYLLINIFINIILIKIIFILDKTKKRRLNIKRL